MRSKVHTITSLVPPPIEAREEGVHVGDVIRWVGESVGESEEERIKREGEERARRETGEINLRMCLGLAWEAWLFGTLGIDNQPGECGRGGCYGNPDGIIHTGDGRVVLVECKLTYKSTRMGEELPWYWLFQIKAYCWMLSTNIARVFVIHVNGDYKWDHWGDKPIMLVHNIEFEDWELEVVGETIRKAVQQLSRKK